MQLANTLSSPERSRAANAAGKLLAQDVAAALAKLNDEKSVRWVPGAQVVAEFESRLGTLALRDLRESCDPLTPHDVGQAILEAISRHEHRGNQMDPRRESPQLVSSWGARQEQVFQPIGDEKCPRCGHDPESCFGAFADEDA
jgi:hypothetical protein